MPSNSKKSSKPKSLKNTTLWPPAGINRTIILAILVLASTIGVYYFQNSQAATEVLKSGIAGSYCLDDPADGGIGSRIGVYTCNGTAAQAYSFSNGEIHLGGKGCVAVQGASATTGFTQAPVVLAACSPVPWGGLWTSTSGGFTNNHASSKGTQMCLDVTGGVGHAGAETGVEIYKCNNNANQNWSPEAFGVSSGGGGGGGGGSSSIIGEAKKFLNKENETPAGCNCGGAVIDNANIDTFTQHHPGELWCADFLSWVYWRTGNGLASKGAYVRIASTGRTDEALADDTLTNWFKKHGHFYLNTAYNRTNHPPQSGDFINYDNGTHAGIFDYQSGGTMYSIDGNYGDGVHSDKTYGWATSGHVSGWGTLN